MSENEKDSGGLAVYERIRAEIPQDVVNALAHVKAEFELEVDMVKATYARCATIPGVMKQPDRWHVALRATSALLTKLMTARTVEFVFQPVGLPSPPSQAKVDPSNPTKPRDFRFRVPGLAKCSNPKSPFDGKGILMVGGFADPKTATGASERFRPGHAYKVQGSLSKKSDGSSGTPLIFVNAGDPVMEYVGPNGPIWPDPYAAFSAGLSVSPMSNLLIHPPARYAEYMVEGEVVSARHGVSAKGEYATMVLRDDSIDGTLLKTFGGLTLFLAPGDFPKTQLPTGSRVSAIVTGYEGDEKDATGKLTGNKVNRYSSVVMKTLIDLSGEADEPTDPTKTVVTIPAGSPGATQAAAAPSVDRSAAF